MRIKYLSFLVPALIAACTDEAPVKMERQCLPTQKEFEGQCYDLNECVPACDAETQKCINGTCYDNVECVPGCNPRTEKCVAGTCYDKNACVPECDSDTETCVDGECQAKTECTGKLCKDIATFCNADGEWEACATGYGCHFGYCIKGLAPECEDGQCSDANQECRGGKWVACGSLETCTDGRCTITDETCDPGTCSEDGNYRCNDEQHYESCGRASICEQGQCVEREFTDGFKLWQTCNSNADCARGECIFTVSPSRYLSKVTLGLLGVNDIALSDIDPRIPEGTGICSKDCTRNPDVCDDISSQAQSFTCQVILTGDIAYPPLNDDDTPMPLPFHKALNVDEMANAPFASLCRPNDRTGEFYSKTFCKSCEDSSDCTGGDETCIHGMCLPPCELDSQCPLMFSCTQTDPAYPELTFCMPNSGTCTQCLDADGDGQGFGACTQSGVDCDDFDPNIYYNKPLAPESCTPNYTDDNCNGRIDFLELLGSPHNCSQCADETVHHSTCIVDENSPNIARTCLLDNGNLELDDSTPDAIAETYRFTCMDYCDVGYADCDGNPLNGCEVKLFDTDEDGNIVWNENHDSIRYSLDEDGDAHGTMDDFYVHYCCKTQSDVCYAMPNTHANTKTYWERAVLNEEKAYSTVMDDCDDNHALRFPGNAEVCDGIDNDCNDQSDDGSDETVSSADYKLIGVPSGDATFSLKLGDACVVKSQTGTVCTDTDSPGTIQCRHDAVANESEMYCNAPSNATDTTCDGIDDDCNGKIDDGYVKTLTEITKNNGICKEGIKICENGKEKTIQLYKARNYDINGDGIDSNCDGVDWDIAGAVYVTKYGGGSYDGNDDHAGTASSPIESLEKAFELAKTTLNSKTFYKDIIVSSDVQRNDKETKSKWGKAPINLPTAETTQRYKANLKPARTSSEHLAEYIKNENYNPNQYLFKKGSQTELSPENAGFVRIYGGFSANTGTWTAPTGSTRSTYEYVVSDTTSSGMLNHSSYSLIIPNFTIGKQPTPMSVRFDHMALSIKPNKDAKGRQYGTTFVGLMCDFVGCEYVAMKDSTITVTAPDGHSFSSVPFSNINIWPDSGQIGVDATTGYDDNHSYGNFANNYSKNVCMAKYYDSTNNYWRTVVSSDSSYYDAKCPDGHSPRGGCGAIYCSECGHSNCKEKNGKSGLGPNGGSGATPSNNTSSRCDDANIDYNESKGGRGANGPGGKGGDTSGQYMSFSISGDRWYHDYTLPIHPIYLSLNNYTSSNGKPGTSGSGGGGGGVYRSYDQAGGSTMWVIAGSGGAGGCGGSGGKGGAPGGSAIGMFLARPATSIQLSSSSDSYYNYEVYMKSSGQLTLDLSGDSSVTVTGGTGGDGQDGQAGIDGGIGGKSGGFRDFGHCLKGTAGGAGGAGGGGGGGAAGLAGHAYAYVFVTDKDKLENLENSEFNLPAAFKTKPGNFATTQVMENGEKGSDGKTGSWKQSTAAVNHPNHYALYSSSGGGNGTGGKTKLSTEITDPSEGKTTAFYNGSSLFRLRFPK